MKKVLLTISLFSLLAVVGCGKDGSQTASTPGSPDPTTSPYPTCAVYDGNQQGCVPRGNDVSYKGQLMITDQQVFANYLEMTTGRCRASSYGWGYYYGAYSCSYFTAGANVEIMIPQQPLENGNPGYLTVQGLHSRTDYGGDYGGGYGGGWYASLISRIATSYRLINGGQGFVLEAGAYTNYPYAYVRAIVSVGSVNNQNMDVVLTYNNREFGRAHVLR